MVVAAQWWKHKNTKIQTRVAEEGIVAEGGLGRLSAQPENVAGEERKTVPLN
jgi:hypothetical protein